VCIDHRSTAGLGFAIADRLAAEGCRIVLNGLAIVEEQERAPDNRRTGAASRSASKP
jgi:hypothetical protein